MSSQSPPSPCPCEWQLTNPSQGIPYYSRECWTINALYSGKSRTGSARRKAVKKVSSTAAMKSCSVRNIHVWCLQTDLSNCGRESATLDTLVLVAKADIGGGGARTAKRQVDFLATAKGIDLHVSQLPFQGVSRQLASAGCIASASISVRANLRLTLQWVKVRVAKFPVAVYAALETSGNLQLLASAHDSAVIRTQRSHSPGAECIIAVLPEDWSHSTQRGGRHDRESTCRFKPHRMTPQIHLRYTPTLILPKTTQ